MQEVKSEVRVLSAKVDRIETKLDATFGKVRYVNRRIADVELEFYGQKDQQ